MSYTPSNPYYAWVYLKIGNFEATPIPPQHLISFTCKRGPGNGHADQKTKPVLKHQLVSDIELTLFDETALRVEYELISGQRTVLCCWGYLQGPNSCLYRMEADNFDGKITRAGSAMITVHLAGGAAGMLMHPDYKCYKDMSLLDIVLSVKEENGWLGSTEGDFPTILPMKDIEEQIYRQDETDPSKIEEKKQHRTFMRLNQDPISFLQYEIAPYCISDDGNELGDYRLWFDAVATDDNGNALSGSVMDGILESITDFFKGYLTDLTDPLMLQRKIAMNQILQIADESLMIVNSIVGQIGGALAGLAGALKNLGNIAKGAIAGYIEKIGGDAIKGGLGGMLAKAGINAAGHLIDSVTGKIVGKLDALTGKITDALGNVLGTLDIGKLSSGIDKLNMLTNDSFFLCEDFEKFKGHQLLAKMMRKSIKETQGNVMYFRPLYIDALDGQKISPDYFFDVGTSEDSTVLDFSYENNGSLNYQAVETAGIMAMDYTTNELIAAAAGEEIASLRDPSITTLKSSFMDNSCNILPLSSDTPEGLERLSNTLFSLARQKRAMTGTMTIFGDPNIEACKPCQIAVATKYGQLHYSSGIWYILGITDNIQGGAYTTTLQLFRNPNQNTDNTASVKGNSSVKDTKNTDSNNSDKKDESNKNADNNSGKNNTDKKDESNKN